MTLSQKATIRISELTSEMSKLEVGSIDWLRKKAMIRSHQRVLKR